MTTRGRFVVVVGPDGVGKTSVAKAFIESGEGVVRYFHFRPGRDWEVPAPGMSRIALGPEPSPAVGWLRSLYHLGLSWFAYLRRIRPALKRGEDVLGDRWMYAYVGFPRSLGFGGPPWWGRLVVWVAPRPSLVANLTAPAELILDRKAELSIMEIEAQSYRWASLPVPRLGSFSTADPPSLVAQRIREALP